MAAPTGPADQEATSTSWEYTAQTGQVFAHGSASLMHHFWGQLADPTCQGPVGPINWPLVDHHGLSPGQIDWGT